MDLLFDEKDLEDEDDEGFTIDDLPVSDDYQFKYSWRPDDRNQISVVAAGAGDTLAATFAENHEEALRDPDFAGPASLDQGFDSQGIIWDWRAERRELTSVFSHISEKNDLIYGRNQHEKTDTERYMGRFHYREPLDERHTLSTGIAIERIRYDMDFNAKIVACNDLDPECSTVDAEFVTYRDTLDVSAHEIYVEDRWAIAGRHTLTLGLHYGGDDY